MAIIPGIYSRVRQRSAPSPVFRSSRGATPEAFGAGLGRGLQALGQGIDAVASSFQAIELEEQETELKTLDVEFSNRVRGLMYGDPDTETPGYLSSENDDAVEGHVPLRNDINEASEELIATIKSKRVRDRFTVASDRRTNQAFTQAAQHATRARQSQAVVISQARIANAQNDAATNPVTIKEGLASVEAEVKVSLLKSGQYDEDVIADEVRKQQSELVKVSIAGALGRGDPKQAAMILRQNLEFMTAKDRATSELSVFRSLTLEEAQTIFDEITAQGLEGEEAVEYARANVTGETRVKLITLIDAEEGRKNARIRFAQGQEDRGEVEQDKASDDRGIELAQRIRDKDGLVGAEAEARAVAEANDPRELERALSVLRSDEGVEASRDRAAYDRFVKSRADFIDEELQGIISEIEDPVIRNTLLEQKRDLDPDRFTPTIMRMLREKLGTKLVQDRALEAEQLREAVTSASSAVTEGQSLDDFISTNPGYATELFKSSRAMATLRAVDKARSSGNLFSRNSDGKTLHALRTLPVEQLAQTDLSLHRHKLTPDEYDDASRRVAAALSATATQGRPQGETATYSGVRRILGDILPKSRDYGSNAASESDRDFNRAATNAANLAIHGFITRNDGKVPSEPELNDLVYEAVANLYADDTGFFGSGFIIGEDEVEFSKRGNLTPEQRKTARIDYEHISERRRSQIIEDAKRGNKYPGGSVPPDIMEQAYGAFVLRDIARYNKLIRGE